MKSQVEQLVHLTGHTRYRDLYASNPDGWGPVIAATLAKLLNKKDEPRRPFVLMSPMLRCAYALRLPKDAREGCGCSRWCAAVQSHRPDGKVDSMRCDECASCGGPGARLIQLEGPGRAQNNSP
jgi:hypothetical protein